MSTSESPCHLSGSGRSALASSWKPSTFTESSPLRVVITVPSTPTQSPRSRASNASCTSSPSTLRDTKSWTASDWSRTVANVSLPWRRSRRMRPATRTRTSVSVPGGEVAEVGAQLGEGAVAVEADRVRVDAARPEIVEVGEAPGPLGGHVERDVGLAGASSAGSSGIRLMLGGARDGPAVPFGPPRSRRSRMEAVIVATARTPIGRANKGSLVDLRPDDLGATIVQALLEKAPAVDPGEVEDVIWGCAQPAGEAGYNVARVTALLAGPRGRAGRHRQPLLLVVAADHPHGRARDQGRRGRRVRRRWRRDGEPLPLRHVRRRAGHPQREVRRRRGAHREAHRGRVRLVGSRIGGPARHLHRHGPDGRERGRVRQGHARGDGRVRRALAAACGRVAGERVLRA